MATESFTSAGTTAWVAPVGVHKVKVECWGGGGNGSTSGGGGGAYACGNAVAVIPGTSYNVVVGAAQGNSTFNGTSVVADGASGTTAGSVANSTGDVKYAGGAGRTNNGTDYGGGGGGAGGPDGAGVAGVVGGGSGGNWGGNGGAGDNGSGGATAVAVNASNGTAGSANVKGGGGASGGDNGLDGAIGGAPGGGAGGAGTGGTAKGGAVGQVILTYDYERPSFLLNLIFWKNN